jgi:SAM-dependent methyltransferase
MRNSKLFLHDVDTLAFYDREAAKYAEQLRNAQPHKLRSFLNKLKPRARILELGCGGGYDAEVMLAEGFDVTLTDGSSQLAQIAESRVRRHVKVMRFDQLDITGTFDATWANASLLHVPTTGLVEVLSRVYRALREDGLFYASYKAGDGPGRDDFGRYYNFPARSELEIAYAESAKWTEVVFEEEAGGGYDGVARTWLHVLALKGSPLCATPAHPTACAPP